MIEPALALGITQFTVYVEFSDMQTPEFQAFYDGLAK
jgi:hypothetical protein